MKTLESEKEQKILDIAKDVLNLARNTLVVNLRFMDAALSQLTSCIYKGTSIATDGKYLIYNPKYILKQYKEEKEIPVRDYLHVIFHCIFRHMFVGSAINKKYWDLACDIAVENAIIELDLKAVVTKRQRNQQKVLSTLKDKIKSLTTERIYRFYIDNPLTDDELQYLREMFYGDDHRFWYMSADEKATLGIGKSIATDKSQLMQFTYICDNVELKERWKTLSERMQQDLETFSKRQGDVAGSLTQNLRAVNREKYDYTSFLKKFAVRREVMNVNEDEFDYIFYTYGLKMYEKMPLIEPLEYKEVKRIREFVIAIDTSGSVAGRIVQKFVQKTYNILKSTESFFSKINLHIIQCDADIQEEVKITSQEEFDDYLQHMQIHGLGGTDFRPVFQHVDELIKAKEFIDLRGLIYFTDGYGTFPAKKPDYQTAFVFLEEDDFYPEVPPWAIKLVLQKEDIVVNEY